MPPDDSTVYAPGVTAGTVNEKLIVPVLLAVVVATVVDLPDVGTRVIVTLDPAE